ncbi:MAG: hypothetical protein BWY83_01834 [bacterium ADurb.Bin478]|nr:MAG: hypothetical protein BWY83_01834 [bacterium ADurb.Bin478]
MLEPADGVDSVLDLFGDIGFDLFRTRSRQNGGGGHIGKVDIRELIDIQFHIRKEAQHQQREDHHGRKNRALNRDIS